MGKIIDLKKTKPKMGRNIAIVLSLIISIGIGFYAFATRASFFNIKTLSVNGNDKLTEERVLLYSGIAIGDNIIELDKGEIALNLRSEPYIESVKVEKKLPSNIVLNIVEKKDILVMDGEKKVYLDSNGEVLSISQEFKSYPVPLLEGLKVKASIISKNIEYKNDIDREEFADFIEGISHLNQYENLSRVKISEDETVELYFGINQLVMLGEFKKMDYKFNYLNEILEDLEKKDKIFEKIDFTRGSRVIVEEKLVREEE